MKKLFSSFFRYVGYIVFRPIWIMERIIPRNDKIWIFGAWFGEKYADNSKYLYEYVVQNEKEIKAVWITKSKEIYAQLKAKNFTVYKASSFLGIFFTLIAGYAFLTNGQNDVNCFFINGCKQVWLWHGMPLKKILKCDDAYVKINRYKKLVQEFLNPYHKLNPYVTITSSDFFTPYLAESFGIDKARILNTGLPRCDAFFNEKREKFIEDLRKKYNGAKIFIYMPTFRMASTRDGVKSSLFIEKYGFISREFEEFLGSNNIVFLFKPHFVDSGIKIDIHSEHFIYLEDYMYDDLYCLLNSVDALLTDYSSVYFDFLASKKTTFLLPFDYDDYLLNSRGHFFDMYTEMNSQVCKNWNDFYMQVKNNYKNSEIDLKKFGQYLDGHSSEKIVNFLRCMN